MDSVYKILISLVNWCRYDDTIRCVKELQNFLGKDVCISIVDNASPNNSMEQLLNALSDVRIIKSEANLGYAAGHLLNVNYAIDNGYDAVWILNSDVSLRENSLFALVEAWRKCGDNIYGSITLSSENPDIVDYGGGVAPQDSVDKFVYNSYEGVALDSLPSDFVREVQSVEGSSMFIPLNIIKKYGFMKTDFFMYAEENDFCYRMRNFGIKSYVVRDSIIVHNSAASFKLDVDISWIMSYYRRRNFLRFMHEHYGWSRFKMLNNSDNLVSRLKFLCLYALKKSFRQKHIKDYWLLKAVYHSVLGKSGRMVNPNDYVCFDK